MRRKDHSFRRNPGIPSQKSTSTLPQNTPAGPLRPELEKPLTLSRSALFITDSEGVIRGSSPRSSELFGYPQIDIFGTSIEELIPKCYPSLRSSNRECRIGQPRMRSIDPALSLIGRRKDGTKFPIEFRSITIETVTGPVVFIIVDDTTERVVAPAVRTAKGSALSVRCGSRS